MNKDCGGLILRIKAAILKNGLAALLELKGPYADFARAANVYEDLAVSSSKQISAAASIKLGDLYLKGHGVEQSITNARYWYKNAGDSQEAITTLAGTFSADPAKAARLLEKNNLEAYESAQELLRSPAWLSRDTRPKIQPELRLRTLSEHIVQQNPDVARQPPSILRNMGLAQLEKLAADNNHHAQYVMGLYYQTGTSGFPKDIHAALYWFQKAYLTGNMPARELILSLKDQGANAQLGEGGAYFDSLKRLAGQRHVPSMKALAKLYLGEGAENHIDIPAGIDLLKQLAGDGDYSSQLRLISESSRNLHSQQEPNAGKLRNILELYGTGSERRLHPLTVKPNMKAQNSTLEWADMHSQRSCTRLLTAKSTLKPVKE